MKQNKKIAVTGGIGSGKSTVLNMIAERGYPVMSCDRIYSELAERPEFIAKLCRRFGDITDGCGRLDRKKLSEIVFGDSEKLAKLDEITHPAIYNEMFRRAAGYDKICFCEVPLLFESGAQSLFDGVIVVLRDASERIAGAAKRDNVPEEAVKRRMISQFDYDNGNFTEYYVIHNNSNLAQLQEKVETTLKRIEDEYTFKET